MLNQEQSEDSSFRKRFAIAAFLGLFGALLFPGLSPEGGRWGNALWNLMHIPAFFILTLALFILWPGPRKGAFRSAIVIVLALLVAAGTEWAQAFFERSGNWKDFTFNAAGIGLALLWRLVRKRSKRPWLVFSLVAATTLIVCLWPAWGDVWAETRQSQRLPELGTFQQWETRRLWRAQGNAIATTREGTLRVQIGEGEYSGVSFWPGKQDWTAYSYLSITIDNPGEPFELGIRIDDGASSSPEGDWYSASSMVNSGEHSFEIPIPTQPEQNPAIDFSEVTRLALFTGEEHDAREFIVKSAFLR